MGRSVVRVLSGAGTRLVFGAVFLVGGLRRRWLRSIALTVSGVVFMALATQPAVAFINEQVLSESSAVLPHQRTGSAAGLPHQSGSALTAKGPALATVKPHKLVAVKGALPADRKAMRPAKPRMSYTGPKSKLGAKRMAPPTAVRARMLKGHHTNPPSPSPHGDAHLPGPAATGAEVTKDRTATTSVFRNPDGTLTARVYSRPVHYRTTSGSWADIDTTLTQDSDGWWQEKADAPSARFAADGDDPALVTYGPGSGDEVSYGLQGAAAVQGRASGSSITYPGIARQSDATYVATASGVKETLTLHSVTAPTTWIFPLHLTGLTPSLAPNGSVVFKDASGTVRETIPHGFMEDADTGKVSGEGAISTGVTYSLTSTSDGRPALKVSLDDSWLHSSDRVFPVTVDPTNLNAASSTYVETPYDINFSTDDTLKVGSYDGGTHKANSYLQFSSFGSTFQNDYIEKASLYLDDVWSGGCTAEPVVVHGISSSWTVGTIADYPGLSYGSALGSASFEAGSSCGGSAWHGIDIGDDPSAAGVKLLEGWAHGGTNRGLALTASNSVVAAWKQFASVHSSYPPYLSVTYSAYGADYSIPSQTYTEPTATTTGSMKVTLTNRGAASWSTTGTQLATDIYSTSWSKLTTNATKAYVTSSVSPNSTITMTGTLPALAPGQYYVCWDMLTGGTSFYSTYNVPEKCTEITSADTPPQIDSTLPPSNSVVGSITPQLFARGHDPDNYPGSALTYDFQLYTDPASGSPSLAADSGWVSTSKWTVPSGKVAWDQSYYWIVAVSDGDAQSAWSDPSYFSTTVAQPLITSHLGAAAQGPQGRSVDPQVGNYTTSATDASVSVAGPALSVVRSYNSLDPRTSSLFGAGWSTQYDMSALPDSDGSGAVVVTLASGQEARFGLNADGTTFTPPQGTYATFRTISGSGYTLTDKSGTTYTFGEQAGPAWKLTTIKDASGLSQTLSYNPDGTLAAISDTTSGRSLHLTWSGSHVAQVATDPATAGGAAETWTYSYSGSDLTGVCPPTSTTACTVYSYTTGSSSGSHYRSAVLDADPASYWRLAESSGSSAASEVAVNEGNDKGTYSTAGVTLGAAGPLPGSPTTAATFNGSSGYVSVPADVLHQGRSRAVSLWFKTSSPGVLIGDQSVSIAGTSTATGSWDPVLYVGSDGKLHGHWWSVSGSGSAAFGSTGTVNNNAWHHAVLSSDGVTQTLYLDGSQQATFSGTPDDQSNTITYIGAGYAKSWIDSPADVSYFHGSIAEVAFYTHALGAPAVQEQYTTGSHAAGELIGITLPSGKTDVAAVYDAVHDRASQITDTNGGTWSLANPATKGSGAYYRNSVMANDPGDYWRLGEPSGSQAANETADCSTNAVRYCSDGPATYHNVTLGAAGLYSGGTETAASLNGTSSYVELPSGTIGNTNGPVNVTLELWFKTTTAGGVLFSYQSSPIGTTPGGDYTPALYVGADGHLYGELWDGYLSPMESDGTVTDGAWHQVALSMGSDDVQTLYLDGKQADQRTGRDFNNVGQNYYSLGAGYLSGDWPAQPSNNPNGYFKGSLAEASFFVSELSGDAIAADYAARGASNGATPVTTATVTDPGHKTLTYQYDPGHGGRLLSTTDALGHTVSYSYDANGFVSTVIRPDGDNTSYTHNARGDVLSTTLGDFYPGGVTSYYSYPAEGTYSVTDPRDDEPTSYADARSSGPSDTTYATSYTYAANGDLLTTEDADGNTVRHTYTTGTEAAVGGGTEPSGLLATTEDANNKTTSYAYDSAGDLAQVTAPSGLRTSYTYDALGRRLTATEVSDTYPNGITTNYTYDADDRLLTRTDPATTDAVRGTNHTARTTYAYDADGNATSVAVADTTGGDATRTTSWTFNSHDQVDSVTDPLGHATSYGYDAYGNRASETDADGNAYDFSYSATGELLTTTLTNYTGDPANPSTATSLVLDSRAYDPDGLLSSDTDAMGRTTGYKYHFTHWLYSSSLTNFHNADGSTSSKYLHVYGYDNAGHVVTDLETNALVKTQYTYDAAGRTTQQVFDPAGLDTVTSYGYDGAGNLTSQSVTGGGTTEQSDYSYDTLGDVTAETVHNSSANIVTTHAYDQRGVLTSTTDPRGNVSGATAADYTTLYTSDQAGRLTQVTAPAVKAETDGGTPQQIHPITLYGYDTFGDQSSVDDADGNITTYTYDADGRQVAVSDAAYIPPGSTTSITPTTTAAYDTDGRLTAATDADSNTTHYSYDQLGDVAQIQQPAVGDTTPTTHLTYDADGENLSTTDPTGAVTQITYDDLGRPVTASAVVRQPSTTTDTTRLGYDEAGNQTSLTLPGGEHSTATYDTAGNLLTTTDARSNTTHYAYDLDGRLTKTTLPDQTATTQTYDTAGRLTATANLDASGTTLAGTSYGYDPAGNPTSVKNADQNTTTYAYDASDALIQQTEPVSSTSTITTSFGYDAAGNLTRHTDGDNNATITTFNTLGLPESNIEPSTTAFPNAADRTTTIAYDANGNPTTITRPGGVEVTDAYDADSRMTATSGTGAEATTSNRSYAYDADGRLTSTGAPGGTDTYSYDDRGEVLSASGPSGNATYRYNSDGLLTSRTDKAGTATFTYNPDGQVDTATDPTTGSALTYTYNSTGQVSGIAYGGSGDATRSFGYDPQHRVTSDTLTAPGGTTEASASYGYDDAGNLTAQTTTGTAGAASNTYGYDQAGRLTSWNNGSTTTSYGYDNAGDRTSVTSGSTTTNATYNARDQLTGTSSGSASTTYAYTARGTLSTVTGAQGTEHLGYDAFDQLTTDGSTTYTHDDLGRLATAGSSTFAYDGTGDQTVSDGTENYGRGPDGDLLSISGPGGAALAYTNQHGDLTATFTATGTNLAGSTAYDPYGQTTATSGSQHDLGYQGGWTDPGSHRVATASRWYDPSTGDFTSHDATSQAPVPSVNANPYAYGDDDPLTNADPSGNSSCQVSDTSYRTYHSYTGGYFGGYGGSYGHSSPSYSRGYSGSSHHASHRSSGSDYSDEIAAAQRQIAGAVSSEYSAFWGDLYEIEEEAELEAEIYVLEQQQYARSWGIEEEEEFWSEADAAGYSSCNVSTAPPPPPPPTAKTGLAENPGKRPTGQPKTSESPRQYGTKGPGTGPSDTAPVNLSSRAPSQVTNPLAYQPLDNGRDRIGGGAVLQDADDPGAWPTSGRLLYPDIDTHAYNDQFDDPRSSGDCQSTRKTWVYYQPLDTQGRATGVQACLNEADINFNPNGRTKSFDPTKNTVIVGSDTIRGKNPVNPPGYAPNVDLARGHLLGYQLGGDGGDERNLVPLYNSANSAVMKDIEDDVAAAMKTQTIYYTSRPVYANGTNPIPEEIDITARGTGGFEGTWKVPNIP